MQPTWQDIIEVTRLYREAKTEYWLNENLFSFNWWILFVTTSILIIVWLIILDKKKIFEIIAYGLMVATVATMADTIGDFFTLWRYPTMFIPIPPMVEIHSLQMPIIYMIIYQYFNTWKSFLLAAAINAFAFAFILEPLLVWLGMYEPNHWKYIYSLVPYFAIAVVLKWIINKFKQMDQNYESI